MTARKQNDTAFLDMACVGQLRRDEEAEPTQSQKQSPVERNAKGTNRAKKQVNIQARREIQGLDQERARDGTRERLRLGHEFPNMGETGNTTNEGNMCESAWSSPTRMAVANASKKRTFLDKAGSKEPEFKKRRTFKRSQEGERIG